jgi:hypothetical protein
MILTKDKALEITMNYLLGKLISPVIINRNKFGHALIRTNKGVLYWLFKKDHFHSFNYEMKGFVKAHPEFAGLGESINQEYLLYAIDKNATLIFQYQDNEAIYAPSRQKLLEEVKKIFPEGNFENIDSTRLLKIFCDAYNLKRAQDRENEYKSNDYCDSTIRIHEITYSFPLKLLERYKA